MVRLHRRSEISKLGSAIISELAAGPANAISQVRDRYSETPQVRLHERQSPCGSGWILRSGQGHCGNVSGRDHPPSIGPLITFPLYPPCT